MDAAGLIRLSRFGFLPLQKDKATGYLINNLKNTWKKQQHANILPKLWEIIYLLHDEFREFSLLLDYILNLVTFKKIMMHIAAGDSEIVGGLLLHRWPLQKHTTPSTKPRPATVKEVPVQPSSNLVNRETIGQPRMETSRLYPKMSWVIPEIWKNHFNKRYCVCKSQKKYHSTLRAKRATFTFWVDKS